MIFDMNKVYFLIIENNRTSSYKTDKISARHNEKHT